MRVLLIGPGAGLKADGSFGVHGEIRVRYLEDLYIEYALRGYDVKIALTGREAEVRAMNLFALDETIIVPDMLDFESYITLDHVNGIQYNLEQHGHGYAHFDEIVIVSSYWHHAFRMWWSFYVRISKLNLTKRQRVHTGYRYVPRPLPRERRWIEWKQIGLTLIDPWCVTRLTARCRADRQRRFLEDHPQ